MSTLLLASIAAAALVPAAASGAAVRGVPPSMQTVYAGVGGAFTCLDKSATLTTAQINDDYCDCPGDGSDEPGTSACDKGRFFCVNKGFRGRYVASSLVNDGVCDCCDGSDEWAGRVTCANTCIEDGSEWRRTQAEAVRKAEEGARLRDEYAAAGKAAASGRETKAATAAAALEKLRVEREAAEATVKAAEAAEAIENERRKAEASAKVLDAAAAGLGIGAYTKEQLLALLVQHVQETKTHEALVATLAARARGAGDEAAAAAVTWPAEEAAAAATPYTSMEAIEARDKLASVKAEESKAAADVRAAKEEGEQDFGPDAVFYKLKGACFDLKVNQYTYHACPFSNAKQDYTSLGTFEGWGKTAEGATDYTTMLFSRGQTCWNGPARSLRLLFECGSTDALLSVDEPEKCTYTARFSTPAVCDAKFARELKLELEEPAAPGAGHAEL